MFNDPHDSMFRISYNGDQEFMTRHYLDSLVRSGRIRFDTDEERERHSVALRYRKKSEKTWDFEASPVAIRRIIEKIGMVCLSKTKNEMLMYAHYADQHKGCCLEFACDDDSDFGKAEAVKYVEELPHFDFIEICIRPNVMSQAILTKAKQWAYEKEWRIIHYEKGLGVVKINPRVITGVIFGERTSEADKSKIAALSKREGYSITMYQAKTRKTGFGLDIQPLN